MRSSSNNIKDIRPRPIGRKSVLLAAYSLGLILLCWAVTAAASPRVFVKKIKNGHYQLMVNNKPYIVKGVCYNPIPIGAGHQYDWWSDPNKPWLLDGRLMKEAGINTVRIYHANEDPEKVKEVMRDLYNKYGIRTMLGNWLGFWEGAYPAYGDKKFREKVKEDVAKMVRLYKDEPGVLFWILGNENNYSFTASLRRWSNEEIDRETDPRKQRNLRAKIYYSFVNELALAVKAIDPDHPVAIGNGELSGLEHAKDNCPDVDIVACIIYRGKTFGNIFNSLKSTFDRPIVIAEFGADAYDAYLKKEDQPMQANFVLSQWQQIYKNVSGAEGGAGNCIGGAVFEWSDEWWKNDTADPGNWAVHNTEATWSNPSYYSDSKAEGNKNMNEEWFGIVALSEEKVSGANGLNKRLPRQAYYTIQGFLKDPTAKIPVKKK